MAANHKRTIAVLMGGRSGEHEVSLMSARSVLAAFDRERYQVIPVGISPDGAWWVGEDILAGLTQSRLAGFEPAAMLPDPTRAGLYAVRGADSREALQLLARVDVVFPVLHGTFGEDGTLQGLLELADIAYVGAGVLGSALGMDKAVFKAVMRAEGIPVIDWLTLTRSEIERDPNRVIKRVRAFAEFPVFTKPANLGSSVGITRCESTSDLIEGLYEAARYDRRVVVERGLANPREIEVSVLGNEELEISTPGEIIPSREFYSYEAKYIDGSSELLIPAPISAEQTRQVQDLALRAYRASDCAGMARVDFLMSRDRAEEIYLSELNTIPGFTEISMYAKLWEFSGLSYPHLVDRLVDLALERKMDKDRTERRFRREAGGQ